jgi:hypothetical protein
MALRQREEEKTHEHDTGTTEPGTGATTEYHPARMVSRAHTNRAAQAKTVEGQDRRDCQWRALAARFAVEVRTTPGEIG